MEGSKINKVFFNGTHSDFKAISIYPRPLNRNNQVIEGGNNKTINLGKADSGRSARGTYVRWINTSSAEEVGFTNREYQINILKSSPKKKDDKLIQKDNRIASLVKRHQNRDITLKQLLEEYMVITNEKVLPRNLRHYSAAL